MYSAIVTVVAVLYILWDVNFHICMAFTLVIGRLFQKKIGLKDVTTLYGFCTTQDVNIYVNHMNNARYVRELDYGRFHFYDRTGIFGNVKAVNGHIVQGASTIRYRRSITIFTAYKVETKLVYWDDRSLFIEQRFITFDGFVRAIIMSQQVVVDADVNTIIKDIPGADDRPECPKEIKHWLDAIEMSKNKLRKWD